MNTNEPIFQPIINTILEMADFLSRAAMELQLTADRIRDADPAHADDTIDLASESVNIVRNTIGNLRLDLLLIRVVRACRRIERAKHKAKETAEEAASE